MPNERINVMEAFRTKKITHLITTNLLARGFDQRSVTLVINIGIPFHHDSQQTDCETYLHRIGRTGRMGDVGIALSIIGKIGINGIGLIENFIYF
jgi:superfamily II DNA/RNA helicase